MRNGPATRVVLGGTIRLFGRGLSWTGSALWRDCIYRRRARDWTVRRHLHVAGLRCARHEMSLLQALPAIGNIRNDWRRAAERVGGFRRQPRCSTQRAWSLISMTRSFPSTKSSYSARSSAVSVPSFAFSRRSSSRSRVDGSSSRRSTMRCATSSVRQAVTGSSSRSIVGSVVDIHSCYHAVVP